MVKRICVLWPKVALALEGRKSFQCFTARGVPSPPELEFMFCGDVSSVLGFPSPSTTMEGQSGQKGHLLILINHLLILINHLLILINGMIY